LTASARRSAASRGYYVEVGGSDGSSERIDLDEDGDLHAICAAFRASSAFGHALGQGRRFLGYFEPGIHRAARVPPG
jgi:hypothetical protein